MTDLTPINPDTNKKLALSSNPLSMRLREWGPIQSLKYLKSGQVHPQAALKAHQDDFGYYHTPCRDLPLASMQPPLTYAAKAWLGMTVNHGVKNQMDGEREKVISDFVSDVHGVGWSAYTLDRAIIAWRRLGKEFIPTQGQLMLAAKEARQTPATQVYTEFLRDLHRASGTPPKPKADTSAAQADTIAEKRDFVSRLRASKARGYSIKANGGHRTWLPIDDAVLEGQEARLERMEASA